MKIALIFPPFADPAAPHLALPALTAYLRREGVRVAQTDLNLRFHEWFVTTGALARRLKTMEEEFRRLDALDALDDAQRDRYRALSGPAQLLPELIRRLDGSRTALKDPDTFRFDPRTGRPGHAVHRGIMHMARAQLAHDLPLDRWGWLGAEEMASAAPNGGHPAVARFLDEAVAPWLRRECPDLVGITVPYRQQIFFAAAVSAAAKRTLPGVTTVLGGHVMTQQAGDPGRLAALFDIVDFVAVHDGEEALAGLCRALERDSDPRPGRNLVWRDGDGRVRVSPETRGVNPADLPLPDFDGLDLDGYLSGRVIFPLESSRGCYWNRCTYCSYHRSPDSRRGYRPLPLERTVDAMEDLVRRYGARVVSLVDEAVPPARAARLAREMRDRSLDLSWYFMGRLEEGFTSAVCRELADAGLYGIFFGLESGCPEVLERMGKGIDLPAARRVLDAAADAGLAAHVSLIVGFPGETAEQAEMTFREAAAMVRDRPGFTANAHTFHLVRNSLVYEDPERFGLEGARGDDGRTLAIQFQPQAMEGPDWRETAERAARINAGLRRLTHPRLHTEEEGILYFDNHGREAFLEFWRRGMPSRTDETAPGRPGEPMPVPAGATVHYRRTGEVAMVTSRHDPGGQIHSTGEPLHTLINLVTGARVRVPPMAGRVFSLFLHGDGGSEFSLTAAAVAAAVSRADTPGESGAPGTGGSLDAAAVQGILSRLAEFGAVERVDAEGK